MDSYYIDPSDGDSRQSRSRSDSHLSTTTSQFQDLNIKSSAQPAHEEGGGSTAVRTSTTSYLNPDPPPTSTTTIISSPAPQQLTPFPEFSQAELDANWLFTEPEDITGPTPIVRLDPVQHTPSEQSLGNHPSPSRSNSFPANMRWAHSQSNLGPYHSQYHSTIGVQHFDPRFDLGIQQSYTWPRKSNSRSQGLV